MDLISSYSQIKGKLDTLDFHALWPGFSRCPFALYDDERVVFGDETFLKTDEFIANTAIRYRDEWIAIWKLTEDMDPDVLTGKIAHEMFHAYQMEQKENRFPDEMDALTKYRYSPAYLTLKSHEIMLLAALFERFDAVQYKEFLALRKRRMAEYLYQYRYECGVEAIEGSAQYVEWQALKALNPDRYQKAKTECIGRLKDIHRLMPVRVLCYDAGAALLDICIENCLPANLRVGEETEYLLPDNVLEYAETAPELPADQAIETFYHDTVNAFKAKIKTVTENDGPVAQGSFKLLGVNVFSARYLDEYIYTEYFVQYEDGKPVTLYGNYLLQMRNGNVAAIYADTGT